MPQYLRIPIELLSTYRRDPEVFMRDIACFPSEAISPFFRRRARIEEAVSTHIRNPFNSETLVFDEDFRCNDTFRRFMHIDLAVTRDAVGISMCHAPSFVPGFRTIKLGKREEVVRVNEPLVQYDFIGRIRAQKGEEIIIGDIRDIIYDLTSRGFYISLITFDRFNSVDSIQILKDAGYTSTTLSIDRTTHKIILDLKNSSNNDGFKRETTGGQYTAAMVAFKEALYSNRVIVPWTTKLKKDEHWVKEAKAAELNSKRNKIDHPAGGSIDVLQSMVGSAYNLINNEFEFQEDGYNSMETDKFYAGLPVTDSYAGQGAELSEIQLAHKDRTSTW